MEATLRQTDRGDRQTDAQLMVRIRAKDIDAFEELYRTYRSRIARFLLKRVHRPAMVEEVMDDTLMAVWDRAEAFNGESKLSTWIFAIAYRKAMQALRRCDDPVEDHAAAFRVSLEPTPEDHLRHDRTRLLLLAAIAELSAEHRAVVELTYFRELGYQEIAEIVACPVGTVKTRMFHARRHLKRRLSGALPDWL